MVSFGCTGGDNNAEKIKNASAEGKKGGCELSRVAEIRIADSKGAWGAPNPFKHNPRGPGYIRMSWIFDTLIFKDDKGYVSMIADKWKYDKENRNYVFDIRNDIKWHDGEKLTAKDVVFSFNYFKKHPYKWSNLKFVENVKADGNKVYVKLSKPYAPFIADVAGILPIIPEHVWKDVSEPAKKNDPTAFIGSGPYKYVSYSAVSGSYVYDANEEYFLGKPCAKRLVYIKHSDSLVALKRGEADNAILKPQMADKLGGDFVVMKDKYSWVKKLLINHNKYPFSETAFRQALAYCIDREKLASLATGGRGQAASLGLLSVDHSFYSDKVQKYPYDIDKCTTLIEKTGYKKDGEYFSKDGKLLEIELLASSIGVGGQNSINRDGLILKEMLEKAGIKVNLLNVQQTVADSKVAGGDFDLALSGHGGLLGDAKILNEMTFKGRGAGKVNSAKFEKDDELNRLLKAQLTEMDDEKRADLVKKAQIRYSELLPAISLYYPPNYNAYNPAKKVKWFFTLGGIAKGVPIAQNKMSMFK